MNRSVVVLTVTIALIAGAAGALVGLPWAIAGVVCGALAGFVAGRSGLRPFVAISVAAGAIGGALVGRGIVRALCLPGSCVELEVIGAVVTGIGALVGVGLVVALVTRSFDEYHDAVAANKPPPTAGMRSGRVHTVNDATPSVARRTSPHGDRRRAVAANQPPPTAGCETDEPAP